MSYTIRGATARQMVEAPRGATFVWVNGFLGYPQTLAKNLGREDLNIVRRSWLSPRNIRGIKIEHLVLDHAVRIDIETLDVLDYLRAHGTKVIR